MIKTAKKVGRNTSVLATSFGVGFRVSQLSRQAHMNNLALKVHKATGKHVKATAIKVHNKDFQRGAATAATVYGGYRLYRHQKNRRKGRK